MTLACRCARATVGHARSSEQRANLRLGRANLGAREWQCVRVLTSTNREFARKNQRLKLEKSTAALWAALAARGREEMDAWKLEVDVLAGDDSTGILCTLTFAFPKGRQFNLRAIPPQQPHAKLAAKGLQGEAEPEGTEENHTSPELGGKTKRVEFAEVSRLTWSKWGFTDDDHVLLSTKACERIGKDVEMAIVREKVRTIKKGFLDYFHSGELEIDGIESKSIKKVTARKETHDGPLSWYWTTEKNDAVIKVSSRQDTQHFHISVGFFKGGAGVKRSRSSATAFSGLDRANLSAYIGKLRALDAHATEPVLNAHATEPAPEEWSPAANGSTPPAIARATEPMYDAELLCAMGKPTPSEERETEAKRLFEACSALLGLGAD